MLPERPAARDDVLPQPRLALMDARGNAAPERGPLVGGIHALLVHRVPGLMQRREKGVADVVLAHPGGDPDVARGKLGTERVARLVEPSAFEVVAHLPGNLQAEVELRRFVERAIEPGVVHWRLLG